MGLKCKLKTAVNGFKKHFIVNKQTTEQYSEQYVSLCLQPSEQQPQIQ